eukprot:765078-Pyramimonas_sp.AAC.1
MGTMLALSLVHRSPCARRCSEKRATPNTGHSGSGSGPVRSTTAGGGDAGRSLFSPGLPAALPLPADFLSGGFLSALFLPADLPFEPGFPSGSASCTTCA